MCWSAVETCISAPLSNSLIPAKSIELKKVFLVDMEVLGLLGDTLASDEKYPVLNRDYWTIPIQLQLSKKQKTFSQFFAAFLKTSWNLNASKKKMSLIAFVFPKLRTTKTWLDKCLKSLVSEDPSKRNMVNVPKHCSNMHHSTFIIFIDQC